MPVVADVQRNGCTRNRVLRSGLPLRFSRIRSEYQFTRAAGEHVRHHQITRAGRLPLTLADDLAAVIGHFDLHRSSATGSMMRPRSLPLGGILLATGLTVAACGAGQGKSPRNRPRHSTNLLVHPCGATSATPADTGATARASDSSGLSAPSASPASPSAKQVGFTSALAAWKNAATASAATMNEYLQQAADDLRASGYSGYGTAIAQLTYLAHLPVTNDSPTQQANAHLRRAGTRRLLPNARPAS